MILKQKLKLLCDIGERFGGAAKTGAGGGDCGITLSIIELISTLFMKYGKKGIKPLKFKIYHGQ